MHKCLPCTLCTNGLTILNSELNFSDPVPVILDVAVRVEIKHYSVAYFDHLTVLMCQVFMRLRSAYELHP